MKKERVLQCVTCFAYCQLWSCKKKLLRCPKPYFLFDTLSKRDPTPCSLFFFSLSVNSLSLFLSFLFHFTHPLYITFTLFTLLVISLVSLLLSPLYASPLKQGVILCALIATSSSISLSFTHTTATVNFFIFSSVFAAHSPLFLYTSLCALFCVLRVLVWRKPKLYMRLSCRGQPCYV